MPTVLNPRCTAPNFTELPLGGQRIALYPNTPSALVKSYVGFLTQNAGG